MTELNASIRDITIPRRMRRLPVSPRGFPVPWFVAWLGGVPDFRCIGLGKLVKAIHQHCCWLCDEPLGFWQTYAIGPMCIVKRNVAGVMIPRQSRRGGALDHAQLQAIQRPQRSVVRPRRARTHPLVL